jgi:hypothetical protein
MNWVWFIGGTWIVVGLGLATLIGRSIHVATLRAEGRNTDDVVPVVPPQAAAPAAERHPAAIRRQAAGPTGAGHSPLIAGCVSAAERAPAEHEHRVL